MFDNLLGQDEFTKLLKRDLLGDSLPQALLFFGPPASGKLTAALELARVLSCEVEGGNRAAWNCSCPACIRHRALSHPDLLLFGRRRFPEEIPAALELLDRAPGKAAAYFFIRAVRKLTKRFDPVLYEGEESRLAKAVPLLRDIEERLEAVAPERAESGSLVEGAAAAAKLVAESARKLEALVPDTPPVFQIRAAERWTRLAPWGRKKTAIIENAEEMQDSARNALLKILEEPPRHLTFILISTRRNALIRTIASRLRPYSFKARGGAESALVLERVFRESDAAALEGSGPAVLSVEAYLASRRPFPPEKARKLAGDFLGAALAKRADAGVDLGPSLARRADAARRSGLDLPGVLAGLFEATKEFGQKDESYAGAFPAFLIALGDNLEELLREEALDSTELAWITRASELLREARLRREGYNISASLLVETLAYALEEA